MSGDGSVFDKDESAFPSPPLPLPDYTLWSGDARDKKSHKSSLCKVCLLVYTQWACYATIRVRNKILLVRFWCAQLSEGLDNVGRGYARSAIIRETQANLCQSENRGLRTNSFPAWEEDSLDLVQVEIALETTSCLCRGEQQNTAKDTRWGVLPSTPPIHSSSPSSKQPAIWKWLLFVVFCRGSAKKNLVSYA